MVQRMLATKNEHHSFLAVLWFCFLHYVLRPWPWILVGLVSLVVFPDLADKELGYPMMIVEYLPAGLLGLMVASMLAAFMSTIDTLLNWGVSLLVNDCYKPFLNRDADNRHYVRVSRLLVVVMMIAGGATAYAMQTIRGAWELFFGMTVGIGGVFIMRWWWWRVNAWSEIAAWLATAVVYVGLHFLIPGIPFGLHLTVTALASTAGWILVALLTPPTNEATLLAFYEKVRPAAPGWGPIARRSSARWREEAWRDVVGWCAGLVAIYGGLFGVGKLVLGDWGSGTVYLVLATGAALVIWRTTSVRDAESEAV